MYPAEANHTAKEDDLNGYADKDEGKHDETGFGIVLLWEIRH